MSTIIPSEPMTVPAATAESAALAPIRGAEQRAVFRGVGWHTYDDLSGADRRGPSRPPGLRWKGPGDHGHQQPARVLQGIAGRDRKGGGNGLGPRLYQLRSDDVEDGDSWPRGGSVLLFRPREGHGGQGALARGSTEPADYPRPDLAIEIDMSAPRSIARPSTADLGVAEVWRLIRGPELIFVHLQADGSYAPVEESRFLRVAPRSSFGG